VIKVEQIREIVGELTTASGLLLVDLTVSGSGRIAVYIDRPDRAVTVDDCAELSRLIETKLNRDEADYELEVSSPGTERSLVLPGQYAKHAGRDIQLITDDGNEFAGRLVSSAGGVVVIEFKQKIKDEKTGKKVPVVTRREIMIENIKKAKIVFSK